MKHSLKFLMAILSMSSLLFGGKEILIDLSSQTLEAKDGDKPFITTKISSGMYGHPTPTGNYTAFDKVKDNVSTLYPKRYGKGKDGGAKMPYTIRVTHDGVAIHAGELPKLRSGEIYPDSHGCIRVPYSTARKLYEWTSIGTPIKIIGKANYVDRVNGLRERFAKGEDRAIQEYHDEYSDWGEPYNDSRQGFTYQEGDLDYVDDL